MRRLSILLALVASCAIAVPALAAPASKLQIFGTGDATVNSPTSATLVNEAGEYSGVYLNSRGLSARPIGSVSFSFDYSGTVAGGAPRFSIPIDTDRNGTVDGYAFLDANGCGDTGTVTTTSDTCTIYFNSEVFPNWDAFVAAHPTYRIAPGAIPFIIADQPGTYVLTDIDLR